MKNLWNIFRNFQRNSRLIQEKTNSPSTRRYKKYTSIMACSNHCGLFHVHSEDVLYADQYRLWAM